MSNDNTIFDDVFRTMLEKIPHLIIPLINEVFGTDYLEDEEIIQLKNEHLTPEGRRITDSALRIRNKLYHIECQSSPDSSMVIRMIEYDFFLAMESIKTDNGKYIMEFPGSCILYLRHTESTKDREEIEIHFPEGAVFRYSVPVIKVQEYTRDAIFQKKLLFLLPFYVMRYEKEAGRIEKDNKMLEGLLAEYEEIRSRLWIAFGNENQGKELADLCELIIKISDYIFREAENTRKGVEKIMGGQVLELQTDKAYAAGVTNGEIKAYFKEGYSPEQIAQKAELPVEQVKKVLEELNLA